MVCNKTWYYWWRSHSPNKTQIWTSWLKAQSMPQHPSQSTWNWQEPAYNTAAKKIPTSQPPPQKQTPSPPQNPKTSYHPSRLVIQFRPNSIPPERRPDSSHIVNNINDALMTNPQVNHMKVVAASFNNQGNLILSMCSDQTAEELLKFQNTFSHILANMCEMQEVIIREDRKWFKIQIDGVSTSSLSVGNGWIPNTTDMVHTELAACNLIYANSQDLIVVKPRWLCTEEELYTTPNPL